MCEGVRGELWKGCVRGCGERCGEGCEESSVLGVCEGCVRGV